MISIRKGIAAAAIVTLMSGGAALAAQPATTGQSGLNGQPQVAMNATGAPAQFTAVSAACAPTSPAPLRTTQGTSQGNTPPTFTPWLNITNGQ